MSHGEVEIIFHIECKRYLINHFDELKSANSRAKKNVDQPQLYI